MIELFRRLHKLMTRSQRIRIPFLMVLMLITSLTQVAGVGSVVPFVKILGSPEWIHQNLITASIYEFLGLNNCSEL